MAPPLSDRPVLEALRCAQASLLAYLEADALAANAPASGFTVVDALTRGPNAVIVVDHQDGLRIVAFRGTDEYADWWTNLNILLRKSAWGRVHRGFCLAAECFWPEVHHHVREGRSQGRRVWVAGHSLGGAIAVLAAAKLLAEDADTVAGLCTFGQPAVGSRSFRIQCDRVLGERYVRVVNHTDTVVDKSLFSRHAGRLWYFDADGRLHHDMSFRRSLRDMLAANNRFGGLYMFSTHNMQEYLPLLESQLTK